MEANTRAGVGEDSVNVVEAFRWNNLVAEYTDVFEPPGMPAEHNTVHRIELEPGSVPPFWHQ